MGGSSKATPGKKGGKKGGKTKKPAVKMNKGKGGKARSVRKKK